MMPLTRLASGARAAMPITPATMAAEASIARARVCTWGIWYKATPMPTNRMPMKTRRRIMMYRVRSARSGVLPSSLATARSRRARMKSTTRAMTITTRMETMALNQSVS